MKEKIHVLECIRQGQIGGGESHLLSLVENLDRSRFAPFVLSFTDGPMIGRLEAMGIPVRIIPTLRPFDVTRWKSVKALLREWKIDLVHAHGTRAASNLLWAAHSLNLPLIYTIHGWSFHPDQAPLVRNLRVLGERYLTSRADLNISVSESNQASGRQYMKGFRSVVVNNGIDLKRFDPTRAAKNIKGELCIPDDRLLVLFLARFTAHKQPLALLRAFAQALAKNPKLHLLMVGDGDEKAAALKLIRELDIEDNVTLESFRQDVPDVLAAADLFVLPSLWEGLPIGLLEAMAMGRAVIASNVDGTCEIIRHDDNGWLVDPQNLVPELAEALVMLGRDPERRQRYREAAVQTVSDRFNAVSMTRQIENLYLDLVPSPALVASPAL